MVSPSLEEVKNITKNKEYKRVPISYELFSDIATPIEVLRILKGISNHCYMLESIEDAEKWGRYSFLGFNPLLEFTCQDGIVKIKGSENFDEFNDDEVIIKTKNPSKQAFLGRIWLFHNPKRVESFPKHHFHQKFTSLG